MKNWINALLGLFFCLPLAAQSTYFVTTDGSGNGSSWESASSDLAQILQAAEAGDQVWVAEGTYFPTNKDDRTASFILKNGVKVFGGFAGNETQLTDRKWQFHTTILSGEIGNKSDQNDNSYTIIKTHNVNTETVLDGFVIASGNANGEGPESCATRCGAGWYNDGSNGGFSSPTIVNCVFERNAARDGAAFYSNGNAGNSRPVFVNCTFKDNRADLDGGAVYNDNRNGGKSLPVLEECLFENNLASYGAGIFVKSASSSDAINLDLRNCTFKENTAFLWGGGIYTMGQPTEAAIRMTDCKFAENYPTDINKTYSLTKKD
ncbi:MAG: hypothetical protein GYB31_12445 [Bacteroidetes bacterium]|nr:hypothetical protein [Bacteroidota bacterium]